MIEPLSSVSRRYSDSRQHLLKVAIPYHGLLAQLGQTASPYPALARQSLGRSDCGRYAIGWGRRCQFLGGMRSCRSVEARRYMHGNQEGHGLGSALL